MKPDRGILCTDGQIVYLWDQTTKTPSLANPLIRTTPPGTLFAAQLHGILPEHGPNLCYGYIYVYIYSPSISAAVTITANNAPLSKETSHLRIRYPMVAPSLALEVP